MSKAYGLAGLRVGYLVADPAVVTEVDKTLLPFAVNLVARQAHLRPSGIVRSTSQNRCDHQ